MFIKFNGDLLRFLGKGSDKDWDPEFVDAAQALGILEHWAHSRIYERRHIDRTEVTYEQIIGMHLQSIRKVIEYSQMYAKLERGDA